MIRSAVVEKVESSLRETIVVSLSILRGNNAHMMENPVSKRCLVYYCIREYEDLADKVERYKLV
jgi:hypothetical protein